MASQLSLTLAFFELLDQAARAAGATRPRLEPDGLEEIGAVARQAADLDQGGALPGSYSAEELVVAALLIFVSEEERYPRPRYRGCQVALERFREALGVAQERQ